MPDRPADPSDEPTAAESGGFLPPEPPPPNAGFPAGAAGGQPPQQQWPAPPAVWHPPAAPVPGNSQAVAGFVLSVVAAGLLVVSFGTSSIISLVCAVLGIVFSRKGRRNVEEGRTPKHGDLARAGLITGIVALVLTVLATAAWIAVIAAAATDGSA